MLGKACKTARVVEDVVRWMLSPRCKDSVDVTLCLVRVEDDNEAYSSTQTVVNQSHFVLIS